MSARCLPLERRAPAPAPSAPSRHVRELKIALAKRGTVRVPAAVRSSYQRICSASRRIAADTATPAGAVATARLAREGAAADRAGTEELYRLAAEIGAYLTVQSLNTPTRSDEETLRDLGTTQPLRFLPPAEDAAC